MAWGITAGVSVEAESESVVDFLSDPGAGTVDEGKAKLIAMDPAYESLLPGLNYFSESYKYDSMTRQQFFCFRRILSEA